MAHTGKTTKLVEVKVWDRRERANVTVEVELEMDLDQLAGYLGAKAFNNSSRRSVMLAGAIVGTIRSRQA